MNEHLLQIRDYEGEGFMPLVNFGTWRVAILNPQAETRAAGMQKLERHMETDEVFVLTAGAAVMLIAGDGPQALEVCAEPMHPGKLYNVRMGVWHGVLLDKSASLLIVENRDTTTANSEYAPLTPEQRRCILEIEKRTGV